MDETIMWDLARKIEITAEAIEALITPLKCHMETITPLLHPSALLGCYVDGEQHESPRDATENYDAFKMLYKSIADSKPFRIDPELPSTVRITFRTPDLQPRQYRYSIKGHGGDKTFLITSPLRFILGFPDYPLNRFRDLLSSERREVDDIRSFLIHYAMLNFSFTRNEGVMDLFKALRFPVRAEKTAEFGELPLICLDPPARLVRPPDEVMLAIHAITRETEFQEVLDIGDWEDLRDPFAAWVHSKRRNQCRPAGLAP
jgi:hypothetical protein